MPLSGPILTLGLLGALVGNVVVALAYLINACNGFLVTVLGWVLRLLRSSYLPLARRRGATLLLVELFCLGCVSAVVSEATLPEERWPKVAGALVLWAALWITLEAVL